MLAENLIIISPIPDTSAGLVPTIDLPQNTANTKNILAAQREYMVTIILMKYKQK